MSVQAPIKTEGKQEQLHTVVPRFPDVQGNADTYFCKKSSTARDINHYRDDIAPLTFFEMKKKSQRKMKNNWLC